VGETEDSREMRTRNARSIMGGSSLLQAVLAVIVSQRGDGR